MNRRIWLGDTALQTTMRWMVTGIVAWGSADRARRGLAMLDDIEREQLPGVDVGRFAVFPPPSVTMTGTPSNTVDL